MKLVMVGCSHHRTPVEVRERLAFTPAQAKEALDQFRVTFPSTEAVLLSTCNRVELYAASNDGEGTPTAAQLGGFLAKFHDLPEEEVVPQLFQCIDREAVSHLFTVAASLDSMILGEAQVASQVKQAYENARSAEHTGPITHAIFQQASFVAKRVTNETQIHRRRVSVPSVAVSEIAAEFFERFDDKKITLIGAGEMGEETLRYLTDAGAKQVTIVNRSIERAEELAQKIIGKVRPWDALESQLLEADLVVSTTGATEPVVTRALFEPIWKKRRKKTILILDLAVPRDFEKSIGELSEVYLYTVDDLQAVCQRNRDFREQEWPKAKRIIDEETDRFFAEIQHRSTGPTIQRLRDQADIAKKAELQRLLGKLQQRGIDPAIEQEITIAFDRLVNKILHPPLQSLRENAQAEHHQTLLDALRRLFQLHD